MVAYPQTTTRPTRYAAGRFGNFDYPQDFLKPRESDDIYEAIVMEENRHTASGAYEGCEGKALRIITSPDDPVASDNAQAFLSALARSDFPWITFALIGTRQKAYCVFTAPTPVLEQLSHFVASFYPNAQPEWCDTSQDLKGLYRTIRTWRTNPAFSPVAVFTDYNPDPYSLILSTMEQLAEDEALAFVASFRPLGSAREKFFTSALGHIDSQVYFSANREKLVDDGASFMVWDQVREKIKQLYRDYKAKFPPLWDVDIFTLAFAASQSRADRLNHTLGHVLGAYDHPFKPTGKTYSLLPNTEFVGDEVWYRNVFNTAELAGLAHFPHKSVESPILMRATKRLRPVPDHLTQPPGLSLGENEHFGTTKAVYLPHARRGQHIYVVGASGSGKSAHMCNLMKQDIDEGAGFALLDPHGDLAERVLALIPEERAADVVYFNPTDREHITPLNIFAGAKNPQELGLIADGVIVTFRRLVESWGDRMENILRQTVYTLLAVGNKTFADIQRMLSDPPFREQVVAQLTNPPLKRFWQYDFPNLPKNACDPITNKFSKFLNPLDPTRFIFSLPETKFNFEDIMQGRKIFLANLAQGQLGEDFSQLLGALLVSQFQLSATRRAAIPEEARTPFTLYVDEFQNFTSGDPKSFEKILSEARKYKLQLVLAHQFTSQLPTGVTDAILGNVYTQIVFRVGLKDAALLQRSFTALTPDDLQNLDIGNALTRCGKSEDSFSLKTRNYPIPPATNSRAQIQAHARNTYSIPVQQAYDHEAAQYKQAAAAAETPPDEEILGRT